VADTDRDVGGFEFPVPPDTVRSECGVGVSGTMGLARLMLHRLNNGWLRIELYWLSGPEYHEVSVDIDPADLAREVDELMHIARA
jgi:hypothetical protein